MILSFFLVNHNYAFTQVRLGKSLKKRLVMNVEASKYLSPFKGS